MKNEILFHATLDHLLEGCQIIGFDWKYLFINRTAELHNKRQNNELIGNRYQEMWPGIETTEVFRKIKETLEKRIPNRLENQFTYPNGTIGWFDLSIQPVTEGVFILSMDITERKLAEAQLKVNEQKYRLLSDSSDDWIYWISPTGQFRYISPSVERLTGYRPEQFEQDPELMIKIVHPDDQQMVRAHQKQAQISQLNYRNEFRITTIDGKTIWVSHTCSPIFSEDGTYLGQRASNRNITDRKLNDELLIESELRFRTIFENGPFGMVVANKEFRFIKVNPMFCSIVGYSPKELTEMTFKDISHPDDLKSDLVNVQKLMSKEIPVYKTEKRYIRKDGKLIWASLTVNCVFDVEENFLYILGIIEDITRRKQAEDDLKKSRELLSETEAIGKVGGWEFNIDTLEQNWTEEVYRIHEVDFDFNPNVNNGINFYSPQSRPVIENAVEHALKFGEPFNLELEIITAKGNLRKIHTVGKSDLDHRRIYGFFQDITQRKQVEEELRKSEKRFSQMFNLGPVAKSLAKVTEQIVIDFNRAAELMFEISRDKVIGKTVDVIDFWVDPNERLRVGELYRKQGYIHGFEFRYKTATGKTGWAKGFSEIIEFNGEKYAYNEYIEITDRKNAEEKIRGLNERISTATQASQVGIWDWDISNNRLTWDDQMYTLYGLIKDEFAGAYEAWVSGLHPDDREYSTRETQLALSGEKEYDTEFRVIWPDGSVRWLKASGQVFYDNDQHPKRMVGVNFDITERKQAEEKLRYNEALLNEVGRISKVGGWEFSPETGEASWTEEVARIHDLDPKTPASVALSINYYSKQSRPIIENAFNEAITLGKSYDLELEINSAKGIKKWVRTIGHPITENGKVIKVRGSIQDITEMKLTIKALQESEEKFRLTFATNPDAITITSLDDGKYISVNSGFTQIFGYPEDQVLNKTSQQINLWFKPEDRTKFIAELKSKGTVENFEARFRTRDGKQKDTLVSATVLEFDGVKHLLSTTKDITERKLAEEALRESEENFRKLIESIPLPVTYVNNAGEIVFRNDRFLQVMGYTFEEVPTVAEWWVKAYPNPIYQAEVMRKWGAAVTNAQKTNTDIEPYEYNITCNDGIERTMIVSGTIIDDNLLITFIDITDRKKAEEEIRKLNETLEVRVEERTIQLKEANQELEAFSYSVSHDLRAPLRHINGFVDLLTQNYNDQLPEKAQHYLEIIVNSSRHMGTLIDDLLQFSRTGRQEMQESNLKMNTILQDVLIQLKHDTESRSIEWTIAELPNIRGDQSLLSMVWYNLLSNAIKFTKSKNPAKIQVGFTDDGKEFTFFVRDNGAGFDMRFAHKLFGVFQRLHTTKEFEGTGIGLANVRRIILKHGGRTWAESQINDGATFYFTLQKPKSPKND